MLFHCFFYCNCQRQSVTRIFFISKFLGLAKPGKENVKRNVKKEKNVSMENVERTKENQGEEIKIVTMGKNGAKENVEHPQEKQNGNGKKE